MSGVYFVGQVGGNLVKIGWTKRCPKERVKALQTGSPKRLKLLGFIPADDMSAEKEIHARFADLRVKGEWFRRSKEMTALFPKPKREKRPTERSLMLFEACAPEPLPLVFYVLDRMWLGISEGAFSLEDVSLAGGLPVLMLAEFVNAKHDDDVLTKAETHEHALNLCLDSLNAPYPMRRHDDADYEAMLLADKRKAGAQ